MFSCKKGFNKSFVIWVSGEWTYYMYGQLILWTDWLRISNHITVIPFSSKPNTFPSTLQASSLPFEMNKIILTFLTNCLWCKWPGLDGEVIAVMCFGFLYNLFTELTVHAYNMFTHLILCIHIIMNVKVVVHRTGWSVLEWLQNVLHSVQKVIPHRLVSPGPAWNPPMNSARIALKQFRNKVCFKS